MSSAVPVRQAASRSHWYAVGPADGPGGAVGPVADGPGGTPGAAGGPVSAAASGGPAGKAAVGRAAAVGWAAAIGWAGLGGGRRRGGGRVEADGRLDAGRRRQAGRSDQPGQAVPGGGMRRIEQQRVPVRRRGLPGVPQRGGDRADRGVRTGRRRAQLDRPGGGVPAVPGPVRADQRAGQRRLRLPVVRGEPGGLLGRLHRQPGPAEPVERGRGQPVAGGGLRLQPDQPVGRVQGVGRAAGGEQRGGQPFEQVGPLQAGGQRVREQLGGLGRAALADQRVRRPRRWMAADRPVPDHGPRG